MKTKVLNLFFSFLLLFGLSACNEAVEIEIFDLSEEKVYIEIGDKYTLPTVTAIDNNQKEYTPVITVTNEKNETVKIVNMTFDAIELGVYNVEYKVTFNGDEAVSKSFEIEVFDLTKPVIENEYKNNIYAPEGLTYDLTKITVTDNSGIEITPQITVYYNGEVIEHTESEIMMNDAGAYVVQVKATDGSGNSITKEYKVFTTLDAESEVVYDNEFVTTEITDKFYRSGNYSYEVGVFDTHVSWFRDTNILGDLSFQTDNSILSFWIMFDISGAKFNGQILFREFSHATRVYDNYGEEVVNNWNDMIEINDQKWYRIEIDMTDPAEGFAAIEELNDYLIYIGTWDFDINNIANKIVKAYIDDIKIVDKNYDASAEYDVKEPTGIPTENNKVIVINDFESAEGFVTSGLVKGLSTDYALNGEKSLKLEGYSEQAWIAINNLFPENAHVEGVTHMYAWFYLPTEGNGEYVINGLTNSVFYRVINDKYVKIEKSEYGTYPIPTNEWVLVGFEIPETGLNFTVEGLYLGGQLVTGQNFQVYIDDFSMLHESLVKQD